MALGEMHLVNPIILAPHRAHNICEGSVWISCDMLSAKGCVCGYLNAYNRKIATLHRSAAAAAVLLAMGKIVLVANLLLFCFSIYRSVERIIEDLHAAGYAAARECYPSTAANRRYGTLRGKNYST